MNLIQSSANEKFKYWKQLSTAKGIKKNKEFFLMGEKLVKEFLKKPNFKIKAELLTGDLDPLTKDSKNIFKLTPELFAELDVLGTHSNLLILELPDPHNFNLDLPQGSIQVICPLGDPANLGALIRSAVGFGVHSVVLTKESAHPFHPKSIKASAGSVLQCPMMTSDLTLLELTKQCDHTVALDLNGTPLEIFEKKNSIRLIVGEEGPGIKGISAQHRIKIETQNIESLNATVAASIALWELTKK